MLLYADCPNCPYQVGGAAALGLLASPELLAFTLDHGIDPFSPESVLRLDQFLSEYDEEVLSREPLRAVLTFSADGDTLSLRVDETGDVVDGPTRPSS